VKSSVATNRAEFNRRLISLAFFLIFVILSAAKDLQRRELRGFAVFATENDRY
jgi:hypothetical protein